MAEDAKQEVEITLGGKSFHARPSFGVVTGIEQALAQPCNELALKAYMHGLPLSERPQNVRALSLTEMSVIIFHMCRGQEGAPKNPAEAGEILMEEGYESQCLKVGDFLGRARKGNREHLKEIERLSRLNPPEAGPAKAA